MLCSFRPSLVALRPARRVGPVAHGDVDEREVSAQLVLGRDGVGAGVHLGHVQDGQQGVTLLRLHLGERKKKRGRRV